eukprot:g7491.t1
MERADSISAMELPLQALATGGYEEPDAQVAADADTVETAQVAVGAGSATFQIVTPATIASDNKEHKVTIAMLETRPSFRYFCTPELEEVAYLQCRATNLSAYPLLETRNGVSIFMDGSFVTKTGIKYTSPGEAFFTFLGVDPSIKVQCASSSSSSCSSSSSSSSSCSCS